MNYKPHHPTRIHYRLTQYFFGISFCFSWPGSNYTWKQLCNMLHIFNQVFLWTIIKIFKKKLMSLEYSAKIKKKCMFILYTDILCCTYPSTQQISRRPDEVNILKFDSKQGTRVFYFNQKPGKQISNQRLYSWSGVPKFRSLFTYNNFSVGYVIWALWNN